MQLEQQLRTLLASHLGERGAAEALVADLAALVRKHVRRCAAAARAQPFYPDTHTGTRQAWLREEIARSIERLAAEAPPP